MSQSAEATPLLDAVEQYLKEINWKFARMEGVPALSMGIKGSNASWKGVAQTIEENTEFIFYSLLDAVIPEPKRVPVVEFLTRVNSGLVLGNFEYDFETATVLFKTSAYFGESMPSSRVLSILIAANTTTVDQCYPSLMGVIYGGQEPSIAADLARATIDQAPNPAGAR